jgi:D-alanyl-lipoteichoic acid acyltransferase DltB (MBOAT superfamily)
VILPLGISFYTFQQVSYLIDTYQGSGSRHSFRNYALFVSFFPQLIAGPILHHDELLPQLEDASRPALFPDRITSALFLFSLGLFKKVVIADTLGEVVKTGFSHPDQLGFAEAWISALAFTFQLYFDFGGYSDMARGMCGFFNLDIPVNFANPYRQKNISDFWKSWHITLTRWFEKYLYFPLALRALRFSPTRSMSVILNIFIFIVIGFWHGPGWPFIVFGFLHGIAISCHKLFKDRGIRFHSYLAWPLTFCFLVITWVFFRSDSLSSAFKMLGTMFGGKGSNLTSFALHVMTDLKASVANLHILFEFSQSLCDLVALIMIILCVFWVFSPWEIDFDDPGAKKGETGRIIAATLMFGSSLFLLTLGYKYEFLYFNF